MAKTNNIAEAASFIVQDDVTCSIAKRRKSPRSPIKLLDRNKPVMIPETEAAVESALVQYLQHHKWVEWGMSSLRKQGNAVLLHGPAGTGKTVIATYLAKRLGRGLAHLSLKEIGGKAPGDIERNADKFFTEARENGGKTIFLDECEGILWDRSKAGGDLLWMLPAIDELLTQIGRYPYLIVLATNKADLLDSALLNRCFAVLQIGMPEFKERMRLWEQKIPPRFPLQLTEAQRQQLANVPMVGRSIETAIIKEASEALLQQRNPSFTSLLQTVEKLAHTK